MPPVFVDREPEETAVWREEEEAEGAAKESTIVLVVIMVFDDEPLEPSEVGEQKDEVDPNEEEAMRGLILPPPLLPKLPTLFLLSAPDVSPLPASESSLTFETASLLPAMEPACSSPSGEGRIL